MVKKWISLLLILVLSLFSLSGCYDARGIETLAYAVAIGLDKGESNLLKLSIQFASSGSSSQGGASSQYTDTTVTTVECSSLESGINLVSSYMSKKVNLSHCKIIVLSETLAKEGVAPYISTFENSTEIRPDCNIIVSRCSAESFLNNSSPGLETLSARYYELVLTSSEYTGYTDNITLHSFFFAYDNDFIEATAILGGINSDKTHKEDLNTAYVSVDGNYKADETPIQNTTSLENMGLAVFRGDKLVGELTGIESLAHLMVTNTFVSSNITVPSPFSQNEIIDLSITKNKDTKNYLVRITLDSTDPAIKSGMFAKSELKFLQKDKALCINRSAIFEKNGKTYAFIIDNDHKVQRKAIQLGIRNEEETEITEGLKEGDRVIIDNITRLREGTEVEDLGTKVGEK